MSMWMAPDAGAHGGLVGRGLIRVHGGLIRTMLRCSCRYKVKEQSDLGTQRSRKSHRTFSEFITGRFKAFKLRQVRGF